MISARAKAAPGRRGMPVGPTTLTTPTECPLANLTPNAYFLLESLRSPAAKDAKTAGVH